MHSSNPRGLGLLLLLSFVGCSIAFDLRLVFNNHSVNPLDFLIPTSFSVNERCRNHSLKYREELAKYTVWATDMFDASTKFPSGIFSGSLYDTGNFDECIRVKIPGDDKFTGQHCMAHFKIAPLDAVPVKKDYVNEYEEYERIFNITTWHKVAKYAHDASKQSRDEIFFTFCIPSSCTHEDLENVLKANINMMKDFLPLKLEVDVDKMSCRVKREFSFTQADLIFMGVVGAFIIIGIISTLYHLFTKLEALEHLRLSGRAHDVLKAFSYSHTMKKLASESKNEEGLDCVHGMKTISMFLIIMGHRIMFCIGSPIGNSVYVESLYQRADYSVMTNGPIIVDTFFTISGFLASYLIIQQIDKRKKMVNVFLLYLHRLLRLTPAYAVVVAFYCTIFIQLGEGPLWDERILVEQERCRESWWTNLLYINNYVKIDTLCIFQSWYLTCDTHYFLIVPFLTYLLWRKPKLGFLFCGILTFASVLTHFLTIYFNEEDPFLLLFMKEQNYDLSDVCYRVLRDPVLNKTFKTIYIPSHMRISPYLVGVIGGFVKFQMRKSAFKITTRNVVFLWVIGLATAFAILFSSFLFYLPTENKDYTLHGFYGSFHHFLWSICITALIVMVSENHGQWVAPYLKWRPWILLSRITYSAFLCHGGVQLYTSAIQRTPMYVGLFNVFYYASADIVFAYVLGFCLTLVFESPILQLEKIILNKKSSISNNIEETEHSNERKQDLKEVNDIYIPRIQKELSWNSYKL